MCFIILIKVYIVAGGLTGPQSTVETLLKSGGTAWQPAASLPSPSRDIAGISLNNGHFLVTGSHGVYKSFISSKSYSLYQGGLVI